MADGVPPPLPNMGPRPRQTVKRVNESLRAPPPSGNGSTPYLDVMTINTTKFPDRVEACRDSHTRLLVEPVPIPDLKHTGVETGLVAKDHALFYPNGGKNASLRQTISASMRKCVDTAELQRTVKEPGWIDPYSSTGHVSLVLNSSTRGRANTTKRTSVKTTTQSALSRKPHNKPQFMETFDRNSTGQGGNKNTVSVRISGVQTPNRRLDVHTKGILTSLRSNSDQLERLLGMANT